jgi:hypothetical protein
MCSIGNGFKDTDDNGLHEILSVPEWYIIP